MATFFNRATLTYSGGTVSSNLTQGEVLEVVSATKTAVNTEYGQNSDITYAVNIINSGNTALNGLSVTDDLGANTVGTVTVTPLDYVDGSVKLFVNGVLAATPTVVEGPPLVISGINIPANSNATLLYTARANNFASPETAGTITNTATVSGAGITPVSDQAIITATNEPVLDITKSLSPTVVQENGEITYTFQVFNYGNTATTATDNVVITDTFDPILSNITVTYNGTTWTEGTEYTYNQATGLFTTTADAITVPAATFVQDPTTGTFTTTPGVATITVTGTV